MSWVSKGGEGFADGQQDWGGGVRARPVFREAQWKAAEYKGVQSMHRAGT